MGIQLRKEAMKEIKIIKILVFTFILFIKLHYSATMQLTPASKLYNIKEYSEN